MALSSEVTANARNLLQAMRFFGSPRTTGEIRDLPGVSLISCGLNYAAFNAALLSEPLGPDSNTFTKRIEIAADFFRSRNLRWTYWLCDDYIDTATRFGRRLGLHNDTRTLFSNFGMYPLTEPVGMFADWLLPPQRRLPEIEIRRVEDEPNVALLPTSPRWLSKSHSKFAWTCTAPEMHG